MTGEEKRRQLKEQYKRDLKQRKEFLDKVKRYKKTERMNKALNDMVDGMKDDSNDWIAQLNQETALTEAKLDMVLDDVVEENKRIENLAKQAEMEKLNAQMMVEQMKKDLGMIVDPPKKEETKAENKADEKESTPQKQEEKKKPDDEGEEDSQKKKTMGDF